MTDSNSKPCDDGRWTTKVDSGNDQVLSLVEKSVEAGVDSSSKEQSSEQARQLAAPYRGVPSCDFLGVRVD